MEAYNDFLNRLNSFEKSKLELGFDYFTSSSSVLSKVNEDNSFKDFYGDTIVFDLDDNIKFKITEIIDKLYIETPQCFCQKLISSTIHMTLHDLSNSPALSDVSNKTFENEINLIKLLSLKQIKKQTIKMNTKFIFNMVNTSLVLGLYPADEKEYIKLMELYNIVDEIKKLPYPFTPHITLAYYNRHGFPEEDKRNLETVVNNLNKTSFSFELYTEKLYYQKFTNMNSYTNIFNLVS